MRIEPSPALAIAIVIAAALIAFASIRSDRAEPFASPSENSLKFELALCNAERFEKRTGCCVPRAGARQFACCAPVAKGAG